VGGGVRVSLALTAADRGDHVESRPRPHRCREICPLLVDVDVDVRAELRRVTEPIAQAWKALVERVQRLRDRLGLDVDAPLEPRKERLQRRREMDFDGAQSSTAVCTEVIPGR
jgi:hypothetical protein